MSNLESIRVAIIDDDTAVLDGLCALIGSASGYRCVGVYRSVEDAIPALSHVRADILLLDIQLPGMSGVEAAKLFSERFPGLQVVMLTVYAEEDKLFACICNGACGYLLKRTTPEKLLEAISDAHSGGSPISPEVARKLVKLFQVAPPPKPAKENLTPQELKLLKWLSEGYSYHACAGKMNISINTVRNYIRDVYDKLHVHSRSEAVAKALRGSLIK